MRHRMYRGALLLFFGVSLLLGSRYGLIFAVALTLLLMLRSVLEERESLKNFPEYRDYRQRTQWRFAPFIW